MPCFRGFDRNSKKRIANEKDFRRSRNDAHQTTFDEKSPLKILHAFEQNFHWQKILKYPFDGQYSCFSPFQNRDAIPFCHASFSSHNRNLVRRQCVDFVSLCPTISADVMGLIKYDVVFAGEEVTASLSGIVAVPKKSPAVYPQGSFYARSWTDL